MKIRSIRLRSIRLHPFAGVADRTHTFEDGAQTILHDNEYGKSTLFVALQHALFTTTNLTRGRLMTKFGANYPRPDGDHCRVTLVLEVDGRAYTLEKTWSRTPNGCRSTLGGDGMALQDADAIQRKLGEWLVHGEPVYERVLLTTQDAIVRTIDDLSEMPDIVGGALAQAIARADGEWDLHRLRSSLLESIEDDEGHWDDGAGEPTRQNGRPRDLENPWVNGVGTVLERYYDMRRSQRALDERRANEAQRDRLADEIASRSADKQRLESAVWDLRARAAHLNLRDRLDQKRQDMQRLEEARTGWPEQRATINIRTSDRTRLETELSRLREEEQRARRRSECEQLLEKRQKVEWVFSRAATLALRLESDFGEWPDDLAARLDSLEQAIARDRIELAAKRLRISMESTRQTTVRVRGGIDAAVDHALDAGVSSALEASGRAEFEVDGVRIVVESGEIEVGALLERIAQNEAALAAELAKIGVPDLQTARTGLAQRHELQRELADTHRIIADGNLEMLRGRMIEAEGELEALRTARTQESLEAERARLESEVQRCSHAILVAEQTIEGWKRHLAVAAPEELYTRHETLRGQKEALEVELAELPVVADADADIEDPRGELRRMEVALEAARDDLRSRELERNRLDVLLENLPLGIDELESNAEGAARRFEQARADLRAKRRVLAELDNALGDEDRFAELSERVRELFGELTGGRYNGLETCDKGLPDRVTTAAEGLELSPAQLSQGAKGALAFAIRLALAESYLKRAPGVLVLDDPFVDLDPSRLRLAIRCLRRVTRDLGVQSILLTCHPAQRQHFDGPLD